MSTVQGIKYKGEFFDNIDIEARNLIAGKSDKNDIAVLRGEMNDMQTAIISKLNEKADSSNVSDNIRSILDAIANLESAIESGLDKDEIAEIATRTISTWLDEHPDATTSIPDDSIGATKIKNGLLPVATPQMFGYTGNDINADTAAIQNAIDNSYTVFFPVGTYKINATLYQNSNGGERNIIGANRMQSIILMDSSITNLPVLHLGNLNGHGNYRGCVQNIKIDGGNIDNGITGILWEEAGTSYTRDVCISRCDIGIKCVGCIHHFIDGNNYIHKCNYGIKFLNTPQGSNNANCSVIKGCWFVGVKKQAIRMQSCGMAEISNNTLQSVGVEGNDEHLIDVNLGTTSSHIGIGPVIYRNWIEGGYYKYAIYVHEVNNCRVESNFIAGSSPGSLDLKMKEGGILLGTNVQKTIVRNNTIIQYFNREPSDGRKVNASIYVTDDVANNGGALVYSNSTPSNHTLSYIERSGEQAYPIIPKSVTCIFDRENQKIIKTAETYGVFGNISRRGTGIYFIPFTYNRLPNSPCFITPCSDGALTYSIRTNGNGAFEVRFYDEWGNLKDPESFFVMILGN